VGDGGVQADESRQAAGQRLKEWLAAAEGDLAAASAEVDRLAKAVPCDTHPNAPVGPECAAVTVAQHGSPPDFDFPPLDHVTLGARLGLFDFPAATAVAGSGFVTLKGLGVQLEQALVMWTLQQAAAAGFTLLAPPDVAMASVVEGCGFNPRPSGAAASSQVYSLADSDLCLIGTSEIAIAGMMAGKTLPPEALPARYAAVSHCFRREAGSHGQRDRGLYRLHQFTKVELFAFTAPSVVYDKGAAPAPYPPDPASEAMLQSLVQLQVSILSQLGLHFRVLDMPTEELGAAAYRKYDVETWMPGRGAAAAGAPSVGGWGEVASASNCIDYQARRLNIRTRMLPPPGKAGAAGGGGRGDVAFVHTLNGTACAIPRVMLSILETHQTRDGRVRIPAPLRPFLAGREFLE
jgi:seryl-tRNA synthetase